MAAVKKKDGIDYIKVKELAKIFCTEDEIADYLGIDAKLLRADEKFNKVYNKSITETKNELRKLQLKFAKEGNIPMITLLGKLYLGQRDKGDDSFKITDYDLTRLPDYFLNRIIAGENPLRVINEYELSNTNIG
jgi:hypothetical protein